MKLRVAKKTKNAILDENGNLVALVCNAFKRNKKQSEQLALDLVNAYNKVQMEEIDKKNSMSREELMKESSTLQQRLNEISRILNDAYKKEIEEKLKLYQGKTWLLLPELLTKELDESEDFEFETIIAVNPFRKGFTQTFVCEKAYLFETHNDIKVYKNFDVSISDFDSAVEITKEQAQRVLSKLAKSLI